MIKNTVNFSVHNNRLLNFFNKKEINYNGFEKANYNKVFQVALSGKVHKFEEGMNKEVIDKKMDDLFGW